MLKKYIYAREDLKIVKVECIINDKILEKLIKEIKANDKFKNENLVDLLNRILICSNDTILSYLIKNLLCYEYDNENELDFLKKALLCFNFKEIKAFFDLKKFLLNYEYKKCLKKQYLNYFDYETILKQIDDFPLIKII